VLSLRRRLALVRVRSLTAFARVVIRGTVLASLRSLAAGTVGGRFASLARDLVSGILPRCQLDWFPDYRSNRALVFLS